MSTRAEQPAPAGGDAVEPAQPPQGGRARVLAVLRNVLIAAVVLAAAYAVVSRWDDVRGTLESLEPVAVALSVLAVMTGIVCGTMSWQVLVDDLGPRVGVRRGGQIFLVGQLGKYAPGSVWAYVLQVELGRRYGLARARVFAASLFSVAVALVASLIAGGLALPLLVSEHSELLWLYALLPVGLVGLHPRILTFAARTAFRLLRRPQPDHDISYGVVLRSLLWALGSYASYGTHLWLLARSSTAAVGSDLLFLCVGVMAVSIIAGLFAILLPSGVGVREAVLISALGPWVGVGRAIALALLSRVVFVLSDLVMAGAATATAVITRRRSAVRG